MSYLYYLVHWLSLRGLKFSRGGSYLGIDSVILKRNINILHCLVSNIHAESSREIFMDFNPAAVSKINEKKLVAPGSIAHSLLSEQKLRAVLENARQILKVCNSCLITTPIWCLCWYHFFLKLQVCANSCRLLMNLDPLIDTAGVF